MVPPKNLERLKKQYEILASKQAPDMFNYDEDIQNVLFEVFTLESALAGLASRRLKMQKIENFDSILGHKIVNRAEYVNENGESIDLSAHPELLGYLAELEKLRSLINSTI